MTKFISMFTAAFVAVLFTLGTATANHSGSKVTVIKTNPPDRCYTVEEMREGAKEGVILVERNLEETVGLTRHYIPPKFEPVFPHPSVVKGSLTSYMESKPYFLFMLVDKEGCLLPPLLLIEGAPPGYTGQDA